MMSQDGQTVAELPQENFRGGGAEAASTNSACSPTPGVLERILVSQGDKVISYSTVSQVLGRNIPTLF